MLAQRLHAAGKQRATRSGLLAEPNAALAYDHIGHAPQ